MDEISNGQHAWAQQSEPAGETVIAPLEPMAEQPPVSSPASANAAQPIGVVLEIAGSSSHIVLDSDRLQECATDLDPSIALAGQVGSQIKIRAGDGWLVANVRTQKRDGRNPDGIIAGIDFLGEGAEDQASGRLHTFRRGVTRYPIPGALVYPATHEDLRQVYASDHGSAVQIGTVFPTDDIRAGVQIDAMLGKHFALLGSTGTGKSPAPP